MAASVDGNRKFSERVFFSSCSIQGNIQNFRLTRMLYRALARRASRRPEKITSSSNVALTARASLLVEWKLTAKAKLSCEIYKLWRKSWKNRVTFCHQSIPVSREAWTLSWILQELRKYPRKTCGCGQPRGHLIRDLNERSVSDGGDFCLLWLVILQSVWYRVGDTF